MNAAMNTATFSANKLATTVGANGIATDAVVTQPALKIGVNEEHELDQQRFKEGLSSSSSRSASPNGYRKVTSFINVCRSFGSKIQDPVAASALAPRYVPTSSKMVEIADPDSSSAEEMTSEDAPAI